MQKEKESLVTCIYSLGKENKKYTIYNLPPTSSSHRDMGMSRLKYSCLRCQLGDQMLSFDHVKLRQRRFLPCKTALVHRVSRREREARCRP